MTSATLGRFNKSIHSESPGSYANEAFSQPGKQCISAIFRCHADLIKAVSRLLSSGISREDISVIGRNFYTEDRIAGFVTKGEAVLDGLRSGIVFGSLTGSALSQLSNVGVLFIPFVGPVVSAGPIGAALLGSATSSSATGTGGGGLVAALVRLGMPREKAAVYQTRLQVGEFLLVVEVEFGRCEDIQYLLSGASAEEMFGCVQIDLERQRSTRLDSAAELSPEIRSHLGDKAQQLFISAYNAALESGDLADTAMLKAWAVVEANYEKDEQGKLSRLR